MAITTIAGTAGTVTAALAAIIAGLLGIILLVLIVITRAVVQHSALLALRVAALDHGQEAEVPAQPTRLDVPLAGVDAEDVTAAGKALHVANACILAGLAQLLLQLDDGGQLVAQHLHVV